LRDEERMALVRERFAAFHAYLAAARDLLLRGRGLRGGARRNVGATVGHALSFATWRSLAREQGLDDDRAAELMCRLVAAAGSRSSS
jgi:hypothetical protein